MYNSTPNITTGKTPSELFFRRQFRDKIPSSLDTKNIFEEDAMDRDQLEKQKEKERKDRKRKATEDIDIGVDDRVYRNNLTEANKIAPNFNATPHVVTRKIGGDVVVRDDVTGKEYRRNVVHLKKLEGEWKIHNNEINNGTGNSKE
nr:unnamed protein product [Callosobruchus chinensis]